jgi:hypothetical protein
MILMRMRKMRMIPTMVAINCVYFKSLSVSTYPYDNCFLLLFLPSKKCTPITQ